MSRRQDMQNKQKALWTSVNWDDMATFIGPNADGYKAFWEKQRGVFVDGNKAGLMLSWSWPALIPLLGIPWAAARKQWVFVGLMVATIIAVNIILIYAPSANFGFMMFLVPTMAKQVYVGTVVTKINKIKETVADPSAQIAAMRDAGGLNMTYGYIAGGVCVGLLALSILSLVFE